MNPYIPAQMSTKCSLLLVMILAISSHTTRRDYEETGLKASRAGLLESQTEDQSNPDTESATAKPQREQRTFAPTRRAAERRQNDVNVGARSDAGNSIRLQAADVVWEIRPNTLAVVARVDGSLIPVSEPQEPREVTRLAVEGTVARWQHPSEHIAVECNADERGLEVAFTCKHRMTLEWPVVTVRGGHGFILPMFEGIYVKPDGAWWAEIAKREFDAIIENLSMPFLGVEHDRGTLAHIVDHPLGTTLDFRNTNEGPTAAFAFHFNPPAGQNTHTVVVRLGARSLIEPALAYRRWLKDEKRFVSMRDKAMRVPRAARLAGAAHAYLWGRASDSSSRTGVSVAMLDRLASAGFDRLCLVLGDLDLMDGHPEIGRRAEELGYLLGPYDSFHSIHHPDQERTWITAHFDADLFEMGSIKRWDGQTRHGFLKRGRALNAVVARPWIERRVDARMTTLPFTSWFVDCDADGQLYRDFSSEHPMTQAQDMQARLDRMQWLSEKHDLVVGSETGASYAAGVIHFAHGMLTPVIGFNDSDMNDPQSTYWIGGYEPAEKPPIIFKTVRLKPEYVARYLDTACRLPLYQAAFHDSVVTTHHWGSASMKFVDGRTTMALLEQLYNVPPLYHLDLDEFEMHRKHMREHFKFFSPLHRRLAFEPLVAFEWLTEDGLVQRTVFGGDEHIELVANFRHAPFVFGKMSLPPRSVSLRGPEGTVSATYTPATR